MNKKHIFLTLLLIIVGVFLLMTMLLIKNLRDTRGRAIPKMKRLEMEVAYTLNWKDTVWKKTIPEKAKPYLFYPLTNLPMENDFVDDISYIRLHNNKLSGYQLKTLPNLLSHSYDITLLNMNSSNVNDRSIIELNSFPSLSIASFKNCPITDKGLGRIPESLKGVCLENTGVKGSFLSETENCSIEYLNLNKCNVDYESIRKLKELKYLKNLELCNAGINGKSMGHISQCKGLEVLKIAGNNITDQDLKFIRNLKRLVHLDLSQNAITDKGISYLTNMDRLSHLKLRGTAVTWKSLEKLALIKNLRWLDLKSTEIKKDDLVVLSKKKPELTVFTD